MGQLMEGLLSSSGWVALVVLFALPALEAPAFLGLVLPGEVALLLGGVLASQGRVPLGAALASGSPGQWAGIRPASGSAAAGAHGCSPPVSAGGSARPASTRSRACCCGVVAGPWSWAAAPPAPGSCSPAWPACWG